MEKGAAVHEKLPREFAELFQAKQAHNVSRADDPPTVGLAAFARAAIQGVPNPRHWRTEVFIDLEFCFVAHARWHCAWTQQTTTPPGPPLLRRCVLLGAVRQQNPNQTSHLRNTNIQPNTYIPGTRNTRGTCPRPTRSGCQREDLGSQTRSRKEAIAEHSHW